MSANNWAICPKCKIKHEEDATKRLADAQEKYGKIPAEEFIIILAEAKKVSILKESLREDYEIGVDKQGEFYVNYGCCCQTCRFIYEYRFNKKLLLNTNRYIITKER